MYEFLKTNKHPDLSDQPIDQFLYKRELSFWGIPDDINVEELKDEEEREDELKKVARNIPREVYGLFLDDSINKLDCDMDTNTKKYYV